MKTKFIMAKPIWWDYIVWYPYDDDEGYDGIHDGGIKGLKDNAPEDAKKEFDEYMQMTQNGAKI